MKEYKRKKIKLERLGGCEDCSKNCLHNGDVAVPDVARRTKGKKFLCNDSRPEYGKNSKIPKKE